MPQAVQRELKVCGGVGVAVGLCDAPLLAVFGVVPFLTSILSTMLLHCFWSNFSTLLQ